MHETDNPRLWSFEMLLERYEKERAARTELENRMLVLSTRAQSLADRKWARAGVHVAQAILSGLAEPRR